MKRKVLGLVILALLLFVPLMAHAATAGKFTSVEGSVDVTSPGKEARPASPGDLLNVGDIIRTKSKSKCEVSFPDGSILRLGESSRLRVNEFVQEKGERNTTLELFRGKIQNVVTALTGAASGQSRYEVQTSTAVCGVRGTDFFVYHQAGVTGAAFKEGSGYGYSRNRPQDVRPIQAGQAMTVSSPNVPPVIRPVSASEMNQHRKDTAPSEKPKSEAKKEEEKKSESVAAKTDEGKKEEQKKEDQKKEEGKKEEQKNGEAKSAEKSTETGKEEEKKSESVAAKTDEGKKEEQKKEEQRKEEGQKKEEQKNGDAKSAGKSTEAGKEEGKKSESASARTDEGKKEEQKTGESKPAEGVKSSEKQSEEPQKVADAKPGAREITSGGSAAVGSQTKAEEPQKTVAAAAPAASNEQSRPVDIVAQTTGVSVSTAPVTLTTGASASTASAAQTAGAFASAGSVAQAAGVAASAAFAAQITGASTSGASVIPTVAIAPSQTILASPSVIPTTINPIPGSSGLGDAVIVPVADAVPPRITRLVPDNFSDDTRITNQSGATFTVEFNENATISYSLDGSNYVSAAGDKLILTGLPEGSNTVFVRGIDPAGNVSSATSYTWKTDYTAPAITLSGTPAAVTNVNSANIGVVATDANAVTTAYRLDGVAVSSPNLTGLTAGSHIFAVTATDAAGNVATKEYAWRTDYTAPVITITPQVAPAANGKAGVKVSLAGNETAAFASLLDGTTSLTSASLDLKDLAPGSHTLKVEAKDEAGNASSQSISFNLDRYLLSGKFSDSGGNASGSATGELANISGQSWGGWNLDMSGSGNVTPSASWTLSAGGKNADGSYWLDIAPGTTDSAAKTLTGKSQLTYLSRDNLGVGTGSVTGQYDGQGAYSLADVGTGGYTQKPLTFMSNINLVDRKTSLSRRGTYSYSGGGYYSYSYDIDNKYGSQNYRPSGVNSSQRAYISYYGDGTMLTQNYDSTNALTSSVTGTWNPATTSLATLLATPMPIAGQTPVTMIPEVTTNRLRETGSMSGLMGGTESLWYETGGTTITATKSGIPVTLMGQYNISGNYGPNTGGNIWHTTIGTPLYSYNYIQGTSMTYEGGSYQGSMGGYELPSTVSGERNLGGRLKALYVDPAGNAGYLEGILTGKAYLGTNMFEMDGALTRTQVETAAQMGVTSASDLAYQWSSMNNVNFNGIFKNGAAAIVGGINGYFNTGNSLTLFNTKSNVSTNWGRYGFILYGSYDTADPGAGTWEAKLGGQGAFGAYKRPGDTYISNSAGYWLADITGTSWASDRITSTVGGRFLSQTLLGVMDGTFGGTYDSTAKTWEAIPGGTWSGTPLKYASSFSSSRYDGLIKQYYGYYTYSGGGSYSYNYQNDNNSGSQLYPLGWTTYRSTSSDYPYQYVNFMSNGTTQSGTCTSSTACTNNPAGTWSTTTDLAALATLFSTTLRPAGTGSWQYQNSGDTLHGIGTLNGNMGGTQSLWSATAATTGIPVTLLGTYYQDTGHANSADNIWYTGYIKSYNYKNGTSTTYDGGSYQGFMAGIELSSSVSGGKVLEGKLKALYIDPQGNAGYLDAPLAGKAYTGINMFEMEGTLSRSQVQIAASLGVNATNATTDLAYYPGYMAGSGLSAGSSGLAGRVYNGNTLSIYNQTTKMPTNWGIYSLTLADGYNITPTTWQTWAGGNGSFGQYNKADNTLLAADTGYWFADINGVWTGDGKINGAMSGRYLSLTKFGSISGDLSGAYNTLDPADKTWQAVSVGTWSGTPLKFMNTFNSSRQNGLRTSTGTSGNYTYSGGGYYNYSYYNDGTWGQTTYKPSSSGQAITYTYYNGDGTTRTDAYDSTGARLNIPNGTWDKTISTLNTLVNTPPPPAASERGSWLSQNNPYSYSYFNGVGSLNGNMGGTQSLWSSSTSIPVSVIGNYSGSSVVGGNIWYSGYLNSFNYNNGTATAYDGGAYQGLMGGIELPSVSGIGRGLAGDLVALYIDPWGNAGYLQGSLAGDGRRGAGAFWLDGTLSRQQMATAAEVGVNVSATNLTTSTYQGWMNTDYGINGAFINGATSIGAIAGTSYGSNTLSIFDKAGSVFQKWGIYGLELSGSYSTAMPTWQAKIGGRGAFGVGRIITDVIMSDEGYWLADITNGIWADGKITGTVGGKYITSRKTGTIDGNLLGVYDAGAGKWQAVSLGAWSGTQLKFGNAFNSGRQYGMNPATRGTYSYTGGGYYWYSYNNDNTWGQKTDQPTSNQLPITFTNYNSNGTTTTNAYDGTGTRIPTPNGTWSGFLSTILTATPAVSGTWSPLSEQYYYFSSIGSLNGNMGGTQSLWYETDGVTINPTKSNVPVTMMGQYSGSVSSPGNLWYSSSFSKGVSPSNDGGAYRGMIGGSELVSASGSTRDLKGMFAALYIDPNGNAGYLKGNLAGNAYPGSGMFALDGLLNRTPMATASDIGSISAANLNASTYGAWLNTDYGVSGAFVSGAAGTGDITGSSYNSGNTLSIYNKASSLYQGWGIYGIEFSGTYSTAMPTWQAKIGGMGGFGVKSIQNDYIFPDDGYWLAGITGQSWADSKLTGTLAGKFITRNKLGDINGDLLGVYDAGAGKWQAISLGTWTGTPLAFNGELNNNFAPSPFWEYQYPGYPGTAGNSITTAGSLVPAGWMQGMIGGTSTLFGTFNISLGNYPAVTLSGLGAFSGSSGSPLFAARFDGTDLTGAAGANGYALLLGDMNPPPASATSMTGGMQGLYWKKNGSTYEIGVLSAGNGVTATVHGTSTTRMWELASGTKLQAYRLFDGLTFATEPVFVASNSNTSTPNLDAEITAGMSGGSWHWWQRRLINPSFNDPSNAKRMEIWAELNAGGYSVAPQPGDRFNYTTTNFGRYNATEITAVDTTNKIFDATTVVTRIFSADSADSGYTALGGGVLKGSFDPITTTWRSIALMTEMDTSAFVNKVSSMDDAKRAAFYAATKIPCYDVGTTTLKGSGGISANTIDMLSSGSYGINNAVFYAPSTGGKPQIWAAGGTSGGVSGAYTGNPTSAGPVTLTGAGGISATFTMQNWGTTNSKWGAKVEGSVPRNTLTGATGFTQTNAVNFKGGAAGNINTGAGTFTGTAAGIVK